METRRTTLREGSSCIKMELASHGDDAEVADIITLDDDDDDVVAGNEDCCLSYKNETVNLCDYECLENGEYINDAIINFYLAYLFDHKLPDEHKKDIQIFSSFFFSNLSSQKVSGKLSAYERVKKWTKKVDIFTKKMIIVPVCEDFHWYLIVICNPGLIKNSKEAHIVKGDPYFIVMDSLKGDDHSMDVALLRSYLKSEYLEKKKRVATFSQESMREHEPAVPQQSNSCDCGVYLLKYVEELFENPGKFYWSKAVNQLRRWFSSKDIVHKREEIANLIRSLSRDQFPDRQLVFPDLTFSRRTRRSATSLAEDLADEVLPEEREPASESERSFVKKVTDNLLDNHGTSSLPTRAEIQGEVKKPRIAKRSEKDSFLSNVDDAKVNPLLTPEEVAHRILKWPLFKDEAEKKDPSSSKTTSTELFDSPGKTAGSAKRQVHLVDKQPAKSCLEIKITRLDRNEFADRSSERSTKSSERGGSGRRSFSVADGSVPFPRMRSSASSWLHDERKRQRPNRLDEGSFDHERKSKIKKGNFHVKR